MAAPHGVVRRREIESHLRTGHWPSIAMLVKAADREREAASLLKLIELSKQSPPETSAPQRRTVRTATKTVLGHFLFLLLPLNCPIILLFR